MILFVYSSFNDLDHMAPIVYGMATRGKRPLALLCQNPSFDLESDFRIAYLQHRFPDVQTGYIDQFNNDAYTNKRAEEFLKKQKTTALVLEYVADLAEYETLPLIQGAKALEIPTIGVPVGLPLFSETYLPATHFKDEVKTEIEYNIVPNRIDAAYRTRCGFDAERLFICGSARFCREWEAVLHDIVPEEPEIEGEDGDFLKLVYMERGADLHGEKNSVIQQALERIAGLDSIRLIIKPHTRSNALHHGKFPSSARIVSGVNSINLIRWADVVMGTNSSILIEALIQGKILLYPRYFHDDRMIFHDYNACVCVDNHESLISALTEIQALADKDYGLTEKTNQLLNAIVYADRENRDVLGDYVAAIEKSSLPKPRLIQKPEREIQTNKQIQPHDIFFQRTV